MDKNFDSAIENFDDCIQKDYKTPEVLLSKGQALYGKAQYEQALECIDEALKLREQYYNAWNSRANILDKMGNKEEALRWYKGAAESSPPNALFLINYCVVLLENGYDDKCKEFLDYIESIYQGQKEQFSDEEFGFIEKCIKSLHVKFDSEKKNDKKVVLETSEGGSKAE